MKPDFVPEMSPLGPRLAAAARALRAARRHTPEWLASVTEVLQRVQQAPLARPGRFARVEAGDLGSIDAPVPSAPPAGGAPPLPDAVRERLRAQVGPAADRLRVHDDEPAHLLAREHGADAVSMGADVYFARGRYQPHDTQGFALLAHEAVHVEHALHPGAAWERSGAPALAAEEASARTVERALRRGAPADPPGRFAPPTSAALPVPPAAPVLAAQPAQRPMAAASDRVLDAPSGPAMDMEAMRQTLMRELMGQIRADMERGG